MITEKIIFENEIKTNAYDLLQLENFKFVSEEIR